MLYMECGKDTRIHKIQQDTKIQSFSDSKKIWYKCANYPDAGIPWYDYNGIWENHVGSLAISFPFCGAAAHVLQYMVVLFLLPPSNSSLLNTLGRGSGVQEACWTWRTRRNERWGNRADEPCRNGEGVDWQLDAPEVGVGLEKVRDCWYEVDGWVSYIPKVDGWTS